MAKRLVAVTNIKHNGILIVVNSTIDHTLFTKEQLKDLYDVGALRLEVDPEIIPIESSVVVEIITETPKVLETPKVVETAKVVETLKVSEKSEDRNVKGINK